ncbi:hypothetical protein ACFXTI_041498 [Malus domestica]
MENNKKVGSGGSHVSSSPSSRNLHHLFGPKDSSSSSSSSSFSGLFGSLFPPVPSVKLQEPDEFLVENQKKKKETS